MRKQNVIQWFAWTPDWNLSTFSMRSHPCNKKNQACKWTSRAR